MSDLPTQYAVVADGRVFSTWDSADDASVACADERATGLEGVHIVAYVPASSLDAANTEIERLRALLATVRCGRCGGSGRYFPHCDFCADSTHDHECQSSTDCASCAGTGNRFHAALTPRPGAKES